MTVATDTPTDTARGPLHGVRVLDVSTILAGPLACQILGDYGADVIKVEHPRLGDSMRGHGPVNGDVPLWWKEVSRNKRGVAIDLGKPEGAEVLRTLLRDADVLVENFRPGTLERWGLDPASLIEENPRLVVARVTGFGQTGPYSARAGFGTLAEAMSGFAHLTGDPGGPPTLPAFGLADTIAGMAASSAISMALYAREQSGRGQVLDINLLAPIMTAVGPGPTAYQQTGEIGMRQGNRSVNNSPRNTYETKDGHWVAISTSAQAIAERVLRLVGHPEVIDEPWFVSGRQRAQHADLLDDYVGSWIRERTRADVTAAFSEAGAAVAPVYDARDIVEDEHVLATGMITFVEDDELGELAMHGPLWGMSETPGSIRFTGRPLGADTDAVLREAGIAPDRVAELRERGVVT
ncbi:CoA transferase [Nocardioides zeae]|uniref:CoA transferase n=1 Tax=Nocardioides imazamoxiresistens TaxID=3231893 RepID=A0ABU3PWJ3_9ACTN|nr:CoA transferase [Nocardioides zeae]MDT9593600.1 CoA transferase [Nocardioides zeae]